MNQYSPDDLAENLAKDMSRNGYDASDAFLTAFADELSNCLAEDNEEEDTFQLATFLFALAAAANNIDP